MFLYINTFRALKSDLLIYKNKSLIFLYVWKHMWHVSLFFSNKILLVRTYLLLNSKTLNFKFSSRLLTRKVFHSVYHQPFGREKKLQKARKDLILKDLLHPNEDTSIKFKVISYAELELLYYSIKNYNRICNKKCFNFIRQN